MSTTRRRAAGSGPLPARLAGAAALAAGLWVALLPSTFASAASYSAYQWGLQVVGASSAWQYGTGSGVRIGIVDTGVDADQQDLSGKVVAGTTILSSPSAGCAGAAQDPNGADDNGHGTHVAGIAAASGRYGVTGMAPGASLVVAKVLDCQGSGQYSDVVSGINWVVQHGANVVNLSLGDASIGGLVDTSNIAGSPLGQALQAAWNAGAVPVIAAGNNSNGVLGLGDANYSGVPAVVVAATGSPSNGEQDTLASYSNGVNEAQWGIAAPGGDDPAGPTTPTCGEYDKFEILSTYWTAANATGCYATDEGTSMATPFVSGTLADLLGRGLSPSQAVQTLLASADHAVSCGTDCSGLLDAAAAMAAAASGQRSSPGPTSTPSPGATTAPTSPSPPEPGPVSSPGTQAAPATSPPARAAAPTSIASKAATRAAALGPRRTPGGPGSPWWLVLAVAAGAAAAAAVGLLGHRRLALRPARGPAETPAPDEGEPPWGDWPSTN
jgi:subtilisin family serine protease